MLRAVTENDAAEIIKIYEPHVTNSHVSFELIAPSEKDMRARIQEYTRTFPWYVWEEGNKVVAYAYASTYRTRAAYQWNAEVSVYVDQQNAKKGVGRKLYEALISDMKKRGYINLYAVIALPNEASIKFHEAMGFDYLGVYKNVGYKLGKWHDVGWWVLSENELPKSPVPILK